MQVKAWKESVTIPTYRIGRPERNPMFLEKRVYQGSSGVVYPYPVIDKVYDDKEDKEWTALFIENKYLKVMILPELGGRIQMAYDKTNDYHFVYYNQVIKPALVGLAGPWISGGIEFNWPQHHRPNTFGPTDYTIEENTDGSKTIWVNEYEIMFRTKCALGFTLHPDKAYIELHARIHNRTPFPQTFLWWANPAVAVDEHYQSVFPPDVHAVYDHGKRDVSSFPIATGTYYKVDYSPGTDISVYTNIPVPTSYMAVNSNYNFVGGYHHKKKAGIMHVANHHVSPGKKQWTWGSGEFGRAWDKHLTDSDGPYFELMCGVYTDNQPDFSWIMPNEVREFRQYFMPYKDVGYVKNASIDAMVNMEFEQRAADIRVYITQERKIRVRLSRGTSILFEETLTQRPETSYHQRITLDSHQLDPTQYTVEVFDAAGRLLVDYTPLPPAEKALPDPAKPIPEPSLIPSQEELYLAGLHLEQYRHATYSAEDYYLEALKRDATDIRCNNALGLLYLRWGDFRKSEPYFRTAVQKLLKHNPNPYDGEPLYNLGLALKYQGRYGEAYNYLFKSTWNAAMQDNAFLQLAYIECRRQNWESALELVETSLARNYFSPRARHLKTLVLHKLRRIQEALNWAADSICHELFDFGNRFEEIQLLQSAAKTTEAGEKTNQFKELIRNSSSTGIEIAIDYAEAGDYAAAVTLLKTIAPDAGQDPLLHYYIAFYSAKLGIREEANRWLQTGFEAAPDCVFPNRLEDIEVLNFVIDQSPEDYKALYYLGNFYYGKRRYENARDCWERSMAINNRFPTVLRNLSIAYCNKFADRVRGLDLLTRAFEADPTDSRILFELDQLKKLMKQAPAERLAFLQNHPSLVEDRDDLYIEFVTLLVLTGDLKKAAELLAARRFHPWEGGEGKTSGQHIHIHVELAKQAMQRGNWESARAFLEAAMVYPENLGEGKLYGAQENDIHFWLGCVHEKMGDLTRAKEYWKKASVGLDQPAPAYFYNDQQPDKIFYQGLALKKLGDKVGAEKRFRVLIDYGTEHFGEEVKLDFFAVSHPDLMIFDDDLSERNNLHCLYLQALGYMGLGDRDKARSVFMEIQQRNPAHLGACLHHRMLENELPGQEY